MFDKQGHRGCRGLMPENTIPGFIKALQLGVTTLELDVVITKDKKVIVSHEAYFNHEISTKPDGTEINEQEQKNYNIYQLTYDEVKMFDVGLKPHPRFPNQEKMAAYKPLLLDMFEAVESYVKTNLLSPVFYNIETKCLPETDALFHPSPDEFSELLMSVIKEKKLENRVMIQSFDIRTLQHIKQYYPDILLSLLVETNDIETQLTSLGFIPDIYSPDYNILNPRLIQLCKEKGMKVIPWTVNALGEIKHLKDVGVDGVISDYPNLFSELN